MGFMTTTPTTPVALADALGSFTDQWSPRIVTTINDYDVRVAKVHGEHVWHTHDNTDEFFLVLEGELHIALRKDACQRTVVLAKGAVFTVPRGIRHPIGWGFELASISVPVLVVHGRHDQFAPCSHGQWLAQRIPGADARLLGHDGHLTLLTSHIGAMHSWLAGHS
jgi:pimeloyl-ACP methyl ester carboxylesterase